MLAMVEGQKMIAGKKIVLVCGSRKWKQRGLIFEQLDKLDRTNTIIVTGGQKGADTLAYEVANTMEFFCVITFPAWWNRQSLAAGPIRNQRMLDWAQPDLVLAFHEDAALGKGTRNMVAITRARGTPVEVFISG